MAYDEAKSDRLAANITKTINKAVYEFEMIRDGDRIAVALSGGKDSFSLLRLLNFRLGSSPEKYSVVALHVVGDARGPEMPPYPAMEEWLKSHGYKYEIRPVHLPEGEALPMDCNRCTHNRRRTLMEMAHDLGCNKMAFGHHFDDFAQTTLMNLVHKGKLETIVPVRSYFGGVVTVIRPLLYVRESELKRFASVNDFPEPPPECPRGCYTDRKRMKDFILDVHRVNPNVRGNLVRPALQWMKEKGLF